MQEARDELLKKYNYEIKYPCGWSKKLEDCKNASDEYINDILEYIVNPFPIEKIKSPNWDQDLLAVANGLKPCCLIDNDSYLDPEIDTFLRHNLENLGIVKKFVISDEEDTGMIYFNKDGSEKALLLALFYKKLLDKKLLNKIDFDYFQAILLGYSKESLVLYNFENEIDSSLQEFFDCADIDENEFQKIETEIRKTEDLPEEAIQFNTKYRYWNPSRKSKCLKNRSKEQKRKLYEKIYEIISSDIGNIFNKYAFWVKEIDNIFIKNISIEKYKILLDL